MIDGQSLVLEEFDFERINGELAPIASWISKNLISQETHFAGACERLQRQLVLVSDERFTHFVRHATEVTARIALDYEKKTVKEHALFYQEFLPAETLLYSVVLANPSRVWSRSAEDGGKLLGKLGEIVQHVPFLQIGGDETTGKGLCAVRLTRGETS